MCETCKALADSLENTRLGVEGAIAIVTMDRPKALNALSDKTLNELDRIFTYLAGAEEILGIILTGEGKGFVAGADISQMQPYGPSEGRAYADRAQTLFNKIEGIEKPVIAAVNEEANLLEKEHKLDLIRWNEAVELASFDYFDINAVLSYLVRVNIVARWTRLSERTGREMFARLLDGLDGKELINKQ